MSPLDSAVPSVRPEALFAEPLARADPDIAAAIRQELGRQTEEIELIASENIVSRAVLEAQGSVLTNKYAEGCSVAATPTYNRIPARRPIRPLSWR